MRFRILGAPQVYGVDGLLLHLEPRQVRLLATLLLSANHVVARARLMEAIWDDEPPETVDRQLKNLVSALRRRLAQAGGQDQIVFESSGYRIVVDDSDLDLSVFADHLKQAKAFQSAAQCTEAVTQLRAGLALWRGPALDGCTARTVEAVAVRLNEQRMTAIEQCLSLELQLGRDRDIADELAELVAVHPMRERLVGQLMLALYRGGRQADALRTYQRLRTQLTDEMGCDPGQELQQLHVAILRRDPDLLHADDPSPEPAATASTTAAPSSTIAPETRPVPMRHWRFVGVSSVAVLLLTTTLYLAAPEAVPRPTFGHVLPGRTTAGPDTSPALAPAASLDPSTKPPVSIVTTINPIRDVTAQSGTRVYVVSKPASELSPPPARYTLNSFANWAYANGGTDADVTFAELTIQGKDAMAVTLRDITITVTRRSAPPTALVVKPAPGLLPIPEVPVRYLSIDLDQPDPTVFVVGKGFLPGGESDFPFQVTAAEPLVLRLRAKTSRCDCTWLAHLHYTVDGAVGTVEITNNGKPFRTTAATNATPYSVEFQRGFTTPSALSDS